MVTASTGAARGSNATSTAPNTTIPTTCTSRTPLQPSVVVHRTLKGFSCLTWRLTDAIDAKISYISRAPWDAKGIYTNSRAVYAEYATLAYGSEPAEEITDIVNQNEPLGSDFGECQATPPFAKDEGKFLLNISRFLFISGDSTEKASRIASDFSSDSGVTRAAILRRGRVCRVRQWWRLGRVPPL